MTITQRNFLIFYPIHSVILCTQNVLLMTITCGSLRVSSFLVFSVFVPHVTINVRSGSTRFSYPIRSTLFQVCCMWTLCFYLYCFSLLQRLSTFGLALISSMYFRLTSYKVACNYHLFKFTIQTFFTAISYCLVFRTFFISKQHAKYWKLK